MDLWDTIGIEFLERQAERKEKINVDNSLLKNILQMAYPAIIPELMSCILIISINDFTFVELRESAVKTLGTFV